MVNYANNYGFGNSMPTATQPYGYPYTQNPFQQMQSQQPTINTNKTYVSGIEDVRLYRLPPNSEYIFLDNDKSILYQKKVDSNGQFEVKAYEITECNANTETIAQSSIDLSNYVPREEFAVLQDEIKALNDKIAKLTTRSTSYGTTNTTTQPTQTKPTVSI